MLVASFFEGVPLRSFVMSNLKALFSCEGWHDSRTKYRNHFGGVEAGKSWSYRHFLNCAPCPRFACPPGKGSVPILAYLIPIVKMKKCQPRHTLLGDLGFRGENRATTPIKFIYAKLVRHYNFRDLVPTNLFTRVRHVLPELFKTACW